MSPFANRERLVRRGRTGAGLDAASSRRRRTLDDAAARADRFFADRYAGVDREPKPWLDRPVGVTRPTHHRTAPTTARPDPTPAATAVTRPTPTPAAPAAPHDAPRRRDA